MDRILRGNSEPMAVLLEPWPRHLEVIYMQLKPWPRHLVVIYMQLRLLLVGLFPEGAMRVLECSLAVPLSESLLKGGDGAQSCSETSRSWMVDALARLAVFSSVATDVSTPFFIRIARP